MTVDICTVLAKLDPQNNSINIPPDVFGSSGSAIETALSEILSGNLKLEDPEFSYTCASNVATIKGTVQEGPLTKILITLVFKLDGSSVEMDLSADLTTDWPLSNAYPSALSGTLLANVSLTNGSIELDVKPSDKDITLKVAATAEYKGQSLNTAKAGGLFEVQHADGSTGFLGGFVVTGDWHPLSFFPPLQGLAFTEGGIFLSTIKETDLSSFDSIGAAFLPSEIDPGATFVASLALEQDLAFLANLLPAGTTLNLTGILPESGDDFELKAELDAPIHRNSFQFEKFDIDWKVVSSLAATLTLGWNEITLTGGGKVDYSGDPSGSLWVFIGGLDTKSPYNNPFGIANISISGFGLSLAFSAEGLDIGLEGDFDIGTVAKMQLFGGILDFEVPSALGAKLSAADQGKSVTLPNLVEAFVPDLDLSSVPLLNGISFKELEVYVVDAPFTIPSTGVTLNPGIGATGDISFYDVNLQFGFTLASGGGDGAATEDTAGASSEPSIQGYGSIGILNGDNLEPIVVKAGSMTVLQISDSTGKKGASCCIDTTGSGYCDDHCTTCSGTAVKNAYICLNGQVQLFGGLLKDSICAVVSKDAFEFNLDFSVLGTSETLSCAFSPKDSLFNASASAGFKLPNLTLGPWGCIPQIKIPLPSASVCFAFGTKGTGATVCGGSFTTPTSDPYFHLQVQFTWGKVDFDIQVNLNLSDAEKAFTGGDFGTWLVSWLESNAEQVFDQFTKGAKAVAETLVNLLYQAGVVVADTIKCVAQFFGHILEDVAKFVEGIFGELGKLCGVSNANSALSASSALQADLMAPALADLTQSDAGQRLLYHYYLHKPEVDSILTSSTGEGSEAHAAIAQHLENERAEPTGRHVHAVLHALHALAPAASDDLRDSIGEVTDILGDHADLPYDELKKALGV